MLVYKKAELIRHGKIRIECGIKTPLERSTTGPSSWEKSIALRLDGRHRVKLKASDNAKFTLMNNLDYLRNLNLFSDSPTCSLSICCSIEQAIK